MSALRRFLIRLLASVTGRRDEARFHEELEDHLAAEADARMRCGLSPEVARREARVAFGSIEAFKDGCRDQQRLPIVEHVFQDVRLALRRMRAAPGFTAAAIATLALGLGLTSAVMTLAYTLFLRPLPVEDASRLVIVDQTLPNRPVSIGYPLSFPDYAHFRDHSRAIADLAAHYSTSPMNVIAPAGPVNLSGAVVTANYFTLLRLQAARGRFFSADQDREPGRNPVAVLS